jgi:hypothetical protein
MHGRSGAGIALWVLVAVTAPAQAGNTPRMTIPFEGMLDLQAQSLSVTVGQEGQGAAVLDITHPGPGQYDLRADLRHVATRAWDVAAVLEGKFVVVGNDPMRRELSGELSTQYTLLNYKPVRDGYLKFAVRERRLIVDAFWFGAFAGKGAIDLMDRHEMDVSLELLSADLDEFWDMLQARGVDTPPVSGIASAALALKGPLARPGVSGRLTAYNGRLKRIDYDNLDLHLEGTFPLIRIAEGRIDPSDGPGFRVTGVVDVSDMPRMGTQLRQLKKELIVEDQHSGRAWAFRRADVDGAQTTQLKSFITGNGDVRDTGESVVGLQKHIGF